LFIARVNPPGYRKRRRTRTLWAILKKISIGLRVNI
jgi:hypothetical protein